MSEYRIKKLEKVDLNLLKPLVEDCFDSKFNLKYFEWKFINNPSGQFVGFVAITDLNQVAAYYGMIPVRYIIDGKSKTIYHSCDTMTHSEHRRKGLFEKLAMHCYDYLKEQGELIAIGFSGKKSTPGFLKFGWSKLFSVVNLFYPTWFSYLRLIKYDNEIEEIVNFEQIENIICKNNKNSNIYYDKNLKIFNWRLSNPNHDYKVISIKKDNYFKSFLVYYIEKDMLILFDFLFEFPEDAVRLMNHLKNKLQILKLKGIISFCQENSNFSKQLIGLRFIINPLSIGPLADKAAFILYCNPDIIKLLESPKNWLINSFDHDAL